MGFGQLQGLLAARRLNHLIPARAQQLGCDAADCVFVFNEEYPACAGEIARTRALRRGWRRRRRDTDHGNMDRQEYAESRAFTGLAFDADPTVRLFHNAVDRGEPKPGSLSHRLGGEEGIEDLMQDFRRNSGAVIRDLDHRLFAHSARISHGLGLFLADARGADLHRTSPVGPDGIARVHRQVHHRRFKLTAIGAYLRQVAAVVSAELDVLVEDPAQQDLELADQLPKIEDLALHRLLARKGQELAYEIGRSRRRLLDFV